MPERIQKVLAHAGIASRRHAEDLIREGRVMVDGRVAAIGEVVEAATARIEVDGEPINRQAHRYLALNKPLGYTTTTASTLDEKTVLDLVSVPERVYPVGRLDKESAGLILLTNDGEWADRIMHPRYEVEKEYLVQVRGVVNQTALRKFRLGALVEGKMAAPKVVEPVGTEDGTSWLKVILAEGRKREIRVIARAAGHPVMYLERVRIGHIRLGHLPAGRFRDLSKIEVEHFREGGRPLAGEKRAATEAEGGHRRPGRSRQDDHRRGPGTPPGRSASRHGPDVSRRHQGGSRAGHRPG
jgi:23S rRNA pseudouridine2605 synthase